ncbi:hypothetical protein EDB84DRAFT_1446552 [Lactarius hengduanensis]|nr:hypothetical protein EDB84DRAFT_1446552 [Lactarius hengduanensis]
MPAPTGTVRVDYIPEEMKKRGGGLERHPGPDNYDGSAEHWPPLEPTELSINLAETADRIGFPLNWNTAKYVLKNSHLIGDVNLDYDDVGSMRQVAPRSSIRGFKDDYHDVDADVQVVVLAGETHINTKPVSPVPVRERRGFSSSVEVGGAC